MMYQIESKLSFVDLTNSWSYLNNQLLCMFFAKRHVFLCSNLAWPKLIPNFSEFLVQRNHSHVTSLAKEYQYMPSVYLDFNTNLNYAYLVHIFLGDLAGSTYLLEFQSSDTFNKSPKLRRHLPLMAFYNCHCTFWSWSAKNETTTLSKPYM